MAIVTVFNFRVKPGMKRAIEHFARRHGVSQAGAIRLLVAQGLQADITLNAHLYREWMAEDDAAESTE